MITLTGVGSVSFRNPDIANKYSLDTNLITRFTRGQKVIAYKDTNWKSIETELFAFSHIDQTSRDAIEIFFNDNLGKEIEITVPRRGACAMSVHTFTGYIYSDVIDYTTTGKNGCSQIYAFGLIILYKILIADLNYLVTEGGEQLVTEAGEPFITEADA